MISRAQWGGIPYTPVRIKGQVSTVFVHHTVTGTEPEARIVKSVEAFHVGQGMKAVAYSFLHGQSGEVYEGRGWGNAGGHTEGWNSRSYAFCAIGHFDKDRPSEPLVASIAAKIREGIELGFIRPDAEIRAHGKPYGGVGTTGCPGKLLAARLNDIRSLVTEESDVPLTDDEITKIALKTRLEMLGDIQTAIKVAAVGDDDIARIVAAVVPAVVDAVVERLTVPPKDE